jgi:hypothetical protein
MLHIRIIHTSNLMKNPIQHWLGVGGGGNYLQQSHLRPMSVDCPQPFRMDSVFSADVRDARVFLGNFRSYSRHCAQARQKAHKIIYTCMLTQT